MKRKKKSSQLRRDLPLVLIFIMIIGLITGIAALAGKLHERSARVEFLKMFNLPEKLVNNIENYAYWKDILSYTDGYEVMVVRIDPFEWTIPENWIVEPVNPVELFQPYDVSIKPALNKLENYNLLPQYPEWFWLEWNPDGLSYERSIYAGFYDRAGTLLLYRAHNLTII